MSESKTKWNIFKNEKRVLEWSLVALWGGAVAQVLLVFGGWHGPSTEYYEYMASIVAAGGASGVYGIVWRWQGRGVL